jgi:FimV-like protein
MARRTLLLLSSQLLLFSAGVAAAQDLALDSLAGLRVHELLARGQALHEQLLPLDALRRFEAVVERDSLHYEAHWKAAREAVNVGMLTEEDRMKEWYVRAEWHARAALRAREDGVQARHWLAVSLGRRALVEGVRTRVQLAEQIREEALKVLELDSLHAGAHNVLGEWNAEVRRLSGLERWVAGNILGGDTMGSASWEAARRHLQRAVELDPDGLIHRLALARVYADTGEEELAREQLREVLDRPVAEPTDPLHKQEAQELLRDLG